MYAHDVPHPFVNQLRSCGASGLTVQSSSIIWISACCVVKNATSGRSRRASPTTFTMSSTAARTTSSLAPTRTSPFSFSTDRSYTFSWFA